MPLVADVSAPIRRTSQHDLQSERLAWRFSVLGAAALGFLITFTTLDHEIRSLKDVYLPLLALLPAYLVLISINTWWAARTTAHLRRTPRVDVGKDHARIRMWRVLRSCGGLAFGVLAALWYVHSVSR
jgi:ABC-type branched-subunit amino acid transport system permease subunit